MEERICSNCAYAGRPTGRWYRVLMSRSPGLLICVNAADAPGVMRGVPATGTCRNFRTRRKPVLRVPPPEPPNDKVRYIALTKGKHAIVDAEDYDRLMRHKWTAVQMGTRWYAQRNAGGHSVMMHREIMHAPKGTVVDHINGNGLDNRKCNLRICTQSQNRWNSRPHDGTSSQFKGVSYDKNRKKYAASVWENRKRIVLGRYDDEVEAAHVRDYRAVEVAGFYAWLNFPEEWPQERIRAVYEAAQARRLSDKEQVISDKQDETLKAMAERIAKKIMETPPDKKAKKPAAKAEKRKEKGKKPKRRDS